MSCIHIKGTRRTGNDAPLLFLGKKDRAAEVAANAASKNPKIRATAAASPHASPQTLLELSQDSEPSVREWVARNTTVAPSVLDGLSYDEHAPIRAFVAWNPNVWRKTLNRLAEDPDAQVRGVAKIVLDNRS